MAFLNFENAAVANFHPNCTLLGQQYFISTALHLALFILLSRFHYHRWRKCLQFFSNIKRLMNKLKLCAALTLSNLLMLKRDKCKRFYFWSCGVWLIFFARKVSTTTGSAEGGGIATTPHYGVTGVQFQP